MIFIENNWSIAVFGGTRDYFICKSNNCVPSSYLCNKIHGKTANR